MLRSDSAVSFILFSALLWLLFNFVIVAVRARFLLTFNFILPAAKPVLTEAGRSTLTVGEPTTLSLVISLSSSLEPCVAAPPVEFYPIVLDFSS